MNFDLLGLYERSKKIDKKQIEVDAEQEINYMIEAILNGAEMFASGNKYLLDKIGLKYTKKVNKGYNGQKLTRYVIKFTKANIKTLQDYLNKE